MSPKRTKAIFSKTEWESLSEEDRIQITIEAIRLEFSIVVLEEKEYPHE